MKHFYLPTATISALVQESQNSANAITVVMATLSYEMNLAIWGCLNHHQHQQLTAIVSYSLKDCQIQEQASVMDFTANTNSA